MRIIKNIKTMAACCVLCLTACQQDEFRSGTSGHVPVRFAPERVTAALTRVTDDEWDDGDEIGIYMVPDTSTNSTDGDDGESDGTDLTKDANEASNIHYVITQNDSETILTAADGTEPIYYPVSGENVGFVAYYPYNAEVSDEGVYQVNVQTQSAPAASDLLYAKTTTGYNKQSTDPVELNFEHKLSKLILKVQAANDITTGLSETDATLKGFPTTADFELKTGELSNIGGIAEIDLEVAEDGETEAEFTVILVPHDGGDYTRTVDFTIDGKVYTYEFDNDFDFTAGISNECTLTFTGTRLTLNTERIEWDYKKDHEKIIIFESSAELEFKLSSDADDIAGTIDWFECGLEQSSTDTETHWITYKLTAAPKSFNIANDDSSPRVGYIHLMENGVSRRVIEVEQDSKALFVDDLPTSPITTLGEGGQETFTIETNSQESEIVVAHENETMITQVETIQSAMDNDGVSEWKITFDVTTNESYRLERDCELYMTIAGQPHTVTVKQSPMEVTKQTPTFAPDGMTNCYVVAPGHSVTFSVKRAYIDPLYANLRVDDQQQYEGEFYLDKVWDSANVVAIDQSTVTYAGSHAGITIQTNETEGNAVVAVKRADTDEIVWSYHIWVGEIDLIGGWMDRNMGASLTVVSGSQIGLGENDRGHYFIPSSSSLLYQWGRKDPFLGAKTLCGEIEEADMTNRTIDDGPGDLTQSIRRPDMMISGWSESMTNMSWDMYGRKTIFDPCPHGYRVPRQHTRIYDKGVPQESESDEYKWYNIGGRLFCQMLGGFLTREHGWSILNQDMTIIGLNWTTEPGIASLLRINDDDTLAMEPQPYLPYSDVIPVRCIAE